MDDLEIFIAVVTAESFTAAAETLGTTTAYTSRRVKALEQRLGTRLLNRTTRRISLTEAGRLYFGRIQRLLVELRDTEQQLTELADEPRGEIRITAPLCFGVKCLAPTISQFIRAYPDLRVELELDDRLVDIVEHKLDLAIRIGYPQDSTQVMRPFGLVRRYFCASPAYLRERGAPRVPSDLVRHACLHYSNVTMREEWTTGGEGASGTAQLEGVFCSNNSEVLCEAACHGAGVALLPEFVASGPLGAGRLERVLEGFEPPPFTLYALYASRQFVPRKIRLRLDFLQENLSVGGECQRSGADAAAQPERQLSRSAGKCATAPKASSSPNA